MGMEAGVVMEVMVVMIEFIAITEMGMAIVMVMIEIHL